MAERELKSPRAVLRAVLRHFEKHPETWVKHVDARTANGIVVPPNAKSAVCFCLRGRILHELNCREAPYYSRIRKPSPKARLYRDILALLGFGVDYLPVYAWNDSRRRKVTQVIERLRKGLEAKVKA